MDPSDIVGTLGWIGWLVGLVSGALQIHFWRRERRIGPAKERLFEEALRDRKGQYTEEQIKDLTALMRKLEQSTKEDIPRQARRVFIESQLDTIRQTLATSMQNYEDLSKELARVTEVHRALPKELAEAVEATIVTPKIESKRRQQRLVMAATAGVLVILFPEVIQYAVNLLFTAFGIAEAPIGTSNLLTYVSGVVVATCLMFVMLGPKLSQVIRRHHVASLVLAVLFTAGWVASTLLVYRSITSSSYDLEYETSVATLSVLLLGVVIRILGPIVSMVYSLSLAAVRTRR